MHAFHRFVSCSWIGDPPLGHWLGFCPALCQLVLCIFCTDALVTWALLTYMYVVYNIGNYIGICRLYTLHCLSISRFAICLRHWVGAGHYCRLDSLRAQSWGRAGCAGRNLGLRLAGMTGHDRAWPGMTWLTWRVWMVPDRQESTFALIWFIFGWWTHLLHVLCTKEILICVGSECPKPTPGQWSEGHAARAREIWISLVLGWILRQRGIHQQSQSSQAKKLG